LLGSTKKKRNFAFEKAKMPPEQSGGGLKELGREQRPWTRETQVKPRPRGEKREIGGGAGGF